MLFWCLFSNVFWLDWHMQGIQTPHIIQRNFLSAFTFNKCTLIFSKSTIYFVWLKKKTNYSPSLLASSYLLPLCIFLLIYILYQRFLYSVRNPCRLWLTMLSYLSFCYKCYGIFFVHFLLNENSPFYFSFVVFFQWFLDLI